MCFEGKCDIHIAKSSLFHPCCHFKYIFTPHSRNDPQNQTLHQPLPPSKPPTPEVATRSLPLFPLSHVRCHSLTHSGANVTFPWINAAAATKGKKKKKKKKVSSLLVSSPRLVLSLDGGNEEKWKCWYNKYLRKVDNASTSTSSETSFISRLTAELRSSVLLIFSSPSLLIRLDEEYDLIVEFDKIVYQEKDEDGVATVEGVQVRTFRAKFVCPSD